LQKNTETSLELYNDARLTDLFFLFWEVRNCGKIGHQLHEIVFVCF